MATPRAPEKAVMFVGVLASNRECLTVAAQALTGQFGMPDRASIVWPFENTDYYLEELGENPIRVFFAWTRLFSTDDIAKIKITTNAIELKLAEKIGGSLSRPVNLDPGYLTCAKLVLASAKNFSHRIHLHDNIYAEVTLQYRGKCFHTLPWTFPDYGAGKYDDFFLALRKVLL